MKPKTQNFVICKQPGRYIGWPSVAKTKDGRLLAGFSGDREDHVCPYGKTQIVFSDDNSKTWSDVQTINDTPLDDRDVGLTVLKSGVIVLAWFTSLFYEQWPVFAESESWRLHSAKISQADRERWLGNWTRRSTDGGVTWEPPVRNNVFAPHGPIQLRDGRLIYLGVGKELSDIRVDESCDEGRSWRCLNSDVIPADLKSMKFDEPHLVELGDGTLLAMYRMELEDFTKRYLWQAKSHDGGRTWSRPHPTPIWGFPPHLLKLRDGRLLVTYGRRLEPFGQRACLSDDGGETWDIEHEIILRDDGPTFDLGYPSSVELDSGEILTVYYQAETLGEKTSLLGTRWKIE